MSAAALAHVGFVRLTCELGKLSFRYSRERALSSLPDPSRCRSHSCSSRTAEGLVKVELDAKGWCEVTAALMGRGSPNKKDADGLTALHLTFEDARAEVMIAGSQAQPP